MATLHWSMRAIKELKKDVPASQRKKIVSIIAELADFPHVRPNLDIKPLTDSAGRYRMRIGDYRVLFIIVEKTPIIITIEHVLRRTSKIYSQR